MSNPFTGMAARLVLLWGWRRFLAAALAGALAALSLPPAGLWPVLFIAFPALVWMMDGAAGGHAGAGARARAGFWLGYAFGLGWFGASLPWIGAAFLVDAERFAWLLPLAVTAMPAGLALFWGLAGAFSAALWRAGPGRIVLLAAAWTLAEGLRGTILSGFPWNLPAHGISNLLAISQTASLTGIYGLSFLVVLWASAPALAADEPISRAGRAARLIAAGLIAASLAASAIYGLFRLHEGGLPEGGPIVRIVQPNIPQREKWKPANRARIFRLLLNLSARPDAKGRTPKIIIWPESAVPFLLDESPAALKAIARMLKPGQILLTGAIRRDRKTGRHFNSLLAIDDEGRVIATYDKRKLVPFGEFLPLAGVLEPLGIRKLVTLPGGFQRGRSDSPILLPGAPSVRVLICYEAIFPSLARGEKRPGWLLNITNDAWFGHSAGPWQHFAMARFRTIETGLPLVRAANTGISAVVDAMGRIIGRMALEKRGVLTLPLPAAGPPALAARIGVFPVMVSMLLVISIIALFCKEKP